MSMEAAEQEVVFLFMGAFFPNTWLFPDLCPPRIEKVSLKVVTFLKLLEQMMRELRKL